MAEAGTGNVGDGTNDSMEKSSSAPPPGLECDASTEMPGKYAPFYGDVHGPAFFGPMISFNSFHGMPFAPDNPDAVSAMTSPLLSSRRGFYQAVPTEETSLRGRERRKQQTKREKEASTAAGRPFHYMSAVCGAAFPGTDLDPFGGHPFQFSTDRIPAVYTTAAATANSYSDAVLHSDVSELLQQLLSEDFCPVPPENSEAPAPEQHEEEHPLPENAVRVASWPTRQQEGPKFSGQIPSGQQDLESAHSDEMKECIAVLAPQMKRKRVTKEGAYKRKKNSTVHEGRSSRFRGVTKHRRSGRWEAHIWIKEMGRQVYLGGYEKEEHAAEAYDVAAIKSKGDKVKTNFDLSKYADLRTVMDSITMDELVMIVRRQSQGFSRGTSVFRGVTHHPSGRWEARIGIPGSKHIYLGLYNDEFEAAKWYDRALVRLRGPNAATNFLLSNYQEELAEYHELQQAVLQRTSFGRALTVTNVNVAVGDASQAEEPKMSAPFENWVKYGRKGAVPMDASEIHEGTREEMNDDAEKLQEKKHLVSQLIMRALTESHETPEATSQAQSTSDASSNPTLLDTETPIASMEQTAAPTLCL